LLHFFFVGFAEDSYLLIYFFPKRSSKASCSAIIRASDSRRNWVRVQYRPQKSLGVPVERFFASLRSEQRGKLDQLGIEIGSFDEKIS
jgi:hypothetical protein